MLPTNIGYFHNNTMRVCPYTAFTSTCCGRHESGEATQPVCWIDCVQACHIESADIATWVSCMPTAAYWLCLREQTESAWAATSTEGGRVDCRWRWRSDTQIWLGVYAVSLCFVILVCSLSLGTTVGSIFFSSIDNGAINSMLSVVRLVLKLYTNWGVWNFSP